MNAADTAAVWSRPALLAQTLRRRHDGHVEVGLRIPALAEPRRALRLQQALRGLEGVLRVTPDVAARRVRIGFDDRTVPLARLLDTCAALGCPAVPLPARSLGDARGREFAQSLRNVLVAGVFSMQAMSFALVLYLGGDGGVTGQLFRWLGFLSAIPVVGYAALPFYRHALATLRASRIGIDVPVAIAILAIFGASAISALRGHGEIYFDSVTMFVLALLIGRHLELRARHRHRAATEAAADATPLVAERRGADGSLHIVVTSELEPGDRVHVAEGAVIPVDAQLENARVQLDESLLTGESRIVMRTCGETVAAGSMVLHGPAELVVIRRADDSAAARIAMLAETVTPMQDADVAAADRAARRFVWRVLAFAAGTALFWLWRDPTRIFDATVAVIVVACPCAFGLAVPAAVTRALAVLARLGVLVARPAALASLTSGGYVLFDKTGTLTEPEIDDANIRTWRDLDADTARSLAIALARESRHPLSNAVAGLLRNGARIPHAEAVESVSGSGMQGTIEGRRLRLGRAGFAHEHRDDDALWLADDKGPLARFPVIEHPRTEAAALIAALRTRGFTAAIASGDSPERTSTVAASLGVEIWAARQTPQDKLDRIMAWRDAGEITLAVGDGGNDAPALAAADVSATLTNGADLARMHADILLGEGLGGIVSACDTARCMRHVLNQNRRWALIYNLAAIPFAAAGLVPPWLAAIGMSLSSLAVVLNSLRIDARAFTVTRT